MNSYYIYYHVFNINFVGAFYEIDFKQNQKLTFLKKAKQQMNKFWSFPWKSKLLQKQYKFKANHHYFLLVYVLITRKIKFFPLNFVSLRLKVPHVLSMKNSHFFISNNVWCQSLVQVLLRNTFWNIKLIFNYIARSFVACLSVHCFSSKHDFVL